MPKKQKKTNQYKILRETIKEIQNSLRYGEKENSRLRGKLEQYEHEEKEAIGNKNWLRNIEIQEIDRLTEIIRWLIEPKTAEKKLSRKEEEILRRGF